MGTMLAELTPPNIPIVVVQEGGYGMNVIGQAAANVVVNLCQGRK